MAAELGGLLLGGGLMVASALYAASFDEHKVDFPVKDEAIKLFNKRYEEATKKDKDNIVLAPKFGDSLTRLRYELTTLGFGVTNVGEDQFVTIDLTPLIRAAPSFAAERRLSAALFDVGLIMSPGEANGFTEPGFFRILCTTYTEEQIAAIRAQLLTVLKTFKIDPKLPSGGSEISRSASVVSEPNKESSKEPSESEVVVPTTEKKRRRTGI